MPKIHVDPADRKNADALSNFINTLADNIDPANDKGALIWKAQPGPQTMGYESLADELFYGGSAGGGKAGHKGSRVVTPYGYTTMGKLKRGDLISDTQGGIQKVINVYEQGMQEFYKITFIDGATTEVSEGHLWFHWYASRQIDVDTSYFMYNPDKGFHLESVRGKIEETRYLYEYHLKQIELEKSGKRPYWIIIPLSKPVEYLCNPELLISPYFMGLMLGDGAMTDTGISITSVDDEIVEYVKTLSNNNFSNSDDRHYVFNGEFKKKLRDSLKHYNLFGKKSHNKFIPQDYLFSSISDRIDLIAGLLDSDGYIDDRGHVSYTTISNDLAKNFQELAWSLGCKATITEKIPQFTYEGVKKNGQLAYTVWIQGEELERFFKLSRKKNLVKPFNGGISDPGRRVIDIQPIGKKEAICIAVNNPNGLYLTDDFIVTHNSDLLLGWATTRGYRSIIYRREFPQLKSIIDRSKVILRNTPAKYNGQDYLWTNIPGGRRLEFGSVQHEESVSKYMGRPYDFIGFDEISNFLESQYIFLTTWNRTEMPGVRTRIIGAGNPPTNMEGEWVIKRWAAWLDPQHGNPASPGELRWYVTLEDKEEEVEDNSPITFKGEEYYPTSRTFIPASLDDNKYYGKEYKARLQSLPTELRAKFLYGDFGLVFEEHPWQVVTNDFIKAGHERWENLKKEGKLEELENINPAYGYDVSEAGDDNAALCKINVNVVQYIKQNNITDIMEQANWIVANMIGHKSSPIAVDANGVGAGLYYRLKQLEYRVTGLKTQSAVRFRDRTGNMQFNNLRSYLWWLLRDALDPHGTIQLALPPDKKLEREIISARWRLTERGLVQVDGKDVLRERLGRSTDMADALMMALYVSHVRRPEMRMI